MWEDGVRRGAQDPGKVATRLHGALLRVSAVLEQGGDERGPARLVTGPQPPSSIPVEVLVEEDVLAPMRIVRIPSEGAVAGPLPVPVRDEQ
jgi:hypothetical protein